MPVVEIENLTKDFAVGFWKKRPMRALDQLDLQVNEGEVFGFLGPNGAGKSTTIKLLMSLLQPTSGTARILGAPVSSTAMHQDIGYLPENPYFYDYLTPEELLGYAGKLFGLGGAELERRTRTLLDDVGLGHAVGRQLRKFSKGMVQRVGLAQAIINEPKIVFLDEPMSGLDPLGRMDVRRIILALKKRGVTVFFSSHILPDVEAICDRIAILNKGRLQEAGTLADILKVGVTGHEIIVSGDAGDVTDGLRGICEEIHLMGERLHLRVKDKERMAQAIRFVFERKMELISVNPIRPSLEEHFQSTIFGAEGGQPVAAHQIQETQKAQETTTTGDN
ncbi:MAG: ABC transporter ATP-binding protein [Acidobacteriota bacterium]|jgi:ABC-2 type transport system ATP-binding protein|nr:ABC transporter ATP-binding protein [Acidobacteriota bacterium]